MAGISTPVRGLEHLDLHALDPGVHLVGTGGVEFDFAYCFLELLGEAVAREAHGRHVVEVVGHAVPQVNGQRGAPHQTPPEALCDLSQDGPHLAHLV